MSKLPLLTLLLLLAVIAAATTTTTVTATSSIPWSLTEGSIDEIEIKPNATAVYGGVCNLDESAAQAICRMLNRPVPAGKTAGILFAPHSTSTMYVDGITNCPAGATNLSGCTIGNFDPAGRACNPNMGFGVDCTGTEIVPAFIFFAFFKPIPLLFNSQNNFLFYFKNAIQSRLGLVKRRTRIMAITPNATSGVINVTFHFLEGNAVEKSLTVAESQFTDQCDATFFGTDLGFQSMHYNVPATPAPPNHDFSTWHIKLTGTAYYVGRVEISTGPGVQPGTVCGTFGFQEAVCTCNQLGYVNGNPSEINFFGGGSGPIVLWDVNCLGATMLQNCAFKSNQMAGVPATTCTHHDDVGVNCYLNMDPPITPAPGTPSPPLYNGTIIAWTATIDDTTWDFFVSGVAQWFSVDESRIQILQLTRGSPHATVVFRFTDAQEPSRDALDLELASTDAFGLEWGLGILALSNNATSAGDIKIKDKVYWQVKIGSDNSGTDGLLNVRPLNATGDAVPWGSVCTGTIEYAISAHAMCRSAGASKDLGSGGLIPWYKTKGSGPVYAIDVVCNLNDLYDNCSMITDEIPSVCNTHTRDLGVMCFAPAPEIQTTQADGPRNVVLYQVTLAPSGNQGIGGGYSQLPIKMAAWIPMAYDRFVVTYEHNHQGGTDLHFYFSDPVVNEFTPTPRTTLDTWLQSISPAGRSALFGIKAFAFSQSVVTPAPTDAPTGADDISDFKFKIHKIESDLPYDEAGVLLVQDPAKPGVWGTMCSNEFSFVEAYAACASAGFRTPNPIFRPLADVVGSAIPTDIQAMPIVITHAYCPYISDLDTLSRCAITLWDTNSYSCNHGQDVVLDCFDNTRKLPPTMFTGIVDRTTYNKTKFMSGFPAAFNISEERVVVTAETPIENTVDGYQWMFINWTFIDDASVWNHTHDSSMPDSGPGSNSIGSNSMEMMADGRKAAVQQALEEAKELEGLVAENDKLQKELEGVIGKKEPQTLLHDGKNKKNRGPGKIVREVASSRARFFANKNKKTSPLVNRQQRSAKSLADPTMSPVAPSSGSNSNWGGFDYGEFTRPQIAWSGRHFMNGASSESVEHEMWLFQPQELWDYFGVFEMRSNTTRPNGAISTDESTWKYALAATLDPQSNHTRCIGADARCYGRLEVQMGAPEAPWGSVCSVGATHYTALVACRQFNPSIAHALVIPGYVYGQGLIALSDLHCKPGDTWQSCTKKASGHKQKRNRCNHNMDMGVMCGTSIAPSLPMPQVFEVTFDLQVFNTSWFPYVFENFTGISHKRINMWDARDTLWYEYWNLDGLPVVKLNMTFTDGDYATQGPSAAWTREDLELYTMSLNSAYSLYQLYGIIEFVNHGPVPLDVNATLVTSYVPNCTNVTCPSTTPAATWTPAPTVMTTNTPAPPVTTRAPPATTTRAPPTAAPTAAPPQTPAPTVTTLAPGQTTATTTASPPTAAPTTITTAAAATPVPPGQTTTASPPTTSATTLAPGQTTTASPPTTATTATTASPTPAPPTPVPPTTTTDASGNTPSPAPTPAPTPVPPVTTATTKMSATTVTTGTTTPAPTTTSDASGNTPSPAPTPLPTTTVATTTATTSGATPPPPPPQTSSQSTGAPQQQTSTTALNTKYAVAFTVPATTEVGGFITNLIAALGLGSSTSTLPYVVRSASADSSSKVIEVSFADQPTQQKALDLMNDAVKKKELSIISAAAVVEGGVTTTAAPADNSGPPIVIIAAAAGGAVLIAIIAFVIYRKKKAGAGEHVDKSGPVTLQYEAMMADGFAEAEELSPTMHHYSPKASGDV